MPVVCAKLKNTNHYMKYVLDKMFLYSKIYFVLVISWIFLFTSRDIGYLENSIKGIFSNLLKGEWDTFVFTFRNI